MFCTLILKIVDKGNGIHNSYCFGKMCNDLKIN